jgi:hypothetical protein
LCACVSHVLMQESIFLYLLALERRANTTVCLFHYCRLSYCERFLYFWSARHATARRVNKAVCSDLNFGKCDVFAHPKTGHNELFTLPLLQYAISTRATNFLQNKFCNCSIHSSSTFKTNLFITTVFHNKETIAVTYSIC